MRRERSCEAIGESFLATTPVHGRPYPRTATGARLPPKNGKVVEIGNHRDDFGLTEQIGSPIYAGARSA